MKLNSLLIGKYARGISVDTYKKTSKGLTQLSFDKLVTQTNQNMDNLNRNFRNNNKQDRIKSFSPQTKNNDKKSYLLPPSKNTGKHTLVLDLDETLIHSSFDKFSYESDIILQVS